LSLDPEDRLKCAALHTIPIVQGATSTDFITLITAVYRIQSSGHSSPLEGIADVHTPILAFTHTLENNIQYDDVVIV